MKTGVGRRLNWAEEAYQISNVTSDFGSPEELSQLLEQLGLRLHARNRIAGGESDYLWHVAEALRAIGRMTSEINAGFGPTAENGEAITPESLTESDQINRFLARLRDEMNEVQVVP